MDGWAEVRCVSQGVGHITVSERQLHSRSEPAAQKHPPALSGFQESAQYFTKTSQQLGHSAV